MWFGQIYGFFGFLAMLVILVATNVLLLYKAKQAALRHRDSLRWQGILTVTLTAGVFLVSYVPDVVIIMIDSLTTVTVSSTTRRAMGFLENVNIISNFFVYCLTVRSFREFLSLRIRRVAQKLGLSSTTAHRSIRSQPSVSVNRNLTANSLIVEDTAL